MTEKKAATPRTPKTPTVDEQQTPDVPAVDPVQETTAEPAAPPAAKAPKQVPTVARVVHYGLRGQDAPLAAIITAVPDDTGTVGLVVFREHLSFFRAGVPFSEELEAGHWTWPPRA